MGCGLEGSDARPPGYHRDVARMLQCRFARQICAFFPVRKKTTNPRFGRSLGRGTRAPRPCVFRQWPISRDPLVSRSRRIGSGFLARRCRVMNNSGGWLRSRTAWHETSHGDLGKDRCPFVDHGGTPTGLGRGGVGPTGPSREEAHQPCRRSTG